MRAGWIRPSWSSFSSVMRATSRRTPSKALSTTALGVSSMIKSTPVRFSSARMLRPSRPMIRPFMSSLGSWTTLTVVSAAWDAASRCMATERIDRTRRSASRLVSSSTWRTARPASWRASSSTSLSSACLACPALSPAMRSSACSRWTRRRSTSSACARTCWSRRSSSASRRSRSAPRRSSAASSAWVRTALCSSSAARRRSSASSEAATATGAVTVASVATGLRRP